MLSSLEVALLLCARLKQIMSLQLLTDAVLPKKGEKLVHKSKTSKLVISVKCIHRKVFFLNCCQQHEAHRFYNQTQIWTGNDT